MKDLRVTDLIDQAEDSNISNFMDQIDSKVRVQTEYSKDDFNEDWLNMFEFTMPYIEKICRNPKRYITNEEEIIKIESAKKVEVESIKHLAKHTNFVQDVDEKTGDIIPSKLLNVFKEETFNTYENRFVYTLLHYMKQFIKDKRDGEIKDPRLKDDKNINYISSTRVGEENISVNVSLKTSLDTSLNKSPEYDKRIEKLEEDIKSMEFTDVYKALEKENVAFVTNPIKRTNVILKNVNFQYAMKLWDYINQNFGTNNKTKKEKKDYYEKGDLRQMIDETFLLEYLAISSLSKENETKDAEETKEKMMKRMLNKIIDMNPELTKQELKDKLGDQFEKVRQVRTLSKRDIEKIFRKHIDKYFTKISNVRI